MMNSRCNKVYGLIGLNAKKGSIVSGGDACERALKSGVKGLLILAGDSSANTRERFLRISYSRSVECVVFGACSELGRRIGRGDRSVMLITDRGLAHNICVILGCADSDNGGVKLG